MIQWLHRKLLLSLSLSLREVRRNLFPSFLFSLPLALSIHGFFYSFLFTQVEVQSCSDQPYFLWIFCAIVPAFFAS